MSCYLKETEELCTQIEHLIAIHPEIMEMESVYELFEIDGFKSNGNLTQTKAAFYKARINHIASTSK